MEQMRAYDPFDAIKNYIMEYRGNMSHEAIQNGRVMFHEAYDHLFDDDMNETEALAYSNFRNCVQSLMDIYTNPETCTDTPFPYDKFDELISLIEKLEESNIGGNESVVLDSANHITKTVQYCQDQCNNIVDIISQEFHSYSRHQNNDNPNPQYHKIRKEQFTELLARLHKIQSYFSPTDIKMRTISFLDEYIKKAIFTEDILCQYYTFNGKFEELSFKIDNNNVSGCIEMIDLNQEYLTFVNEVREQCGGEIVRLISLMEKFIAKKKIIQTKLAEIKNALS